MKRTFLLGYPVAHSLSPQLHNAAFRALGMDWKYELLETPHHQLAQAVDRLRKDDCGGANVTLPHKETITKWLDQLGDSARQVGAVNTIVKRDGKLIGENTDMAGFMRALDDARVNPRGAQVIILGAGGAARAVAFALASAGISRLTIVNRTASRAQELGERLQRHHPGLALEVNRRDDLGNADIIVNATSVGMVPNVAESPLPKEYRVPRGAVAFDLVYNPAETRFLIEARDAGAKTIGGMGMLAHQGAVAFKLWTGRDVAFPYSR